MTSDDLISYLFFGRLTRLRSRFPFLEVVPKKVCDTVLIAIIKTFLLKLVAIFYRRYFGSRGSAPAVSVYDQEERARY